MKKAKFNPLVFLLCFAVIIAIPLLSACNKADNNTDNNTDNSEPTTGNLTIDVTYRNGYNASTLADKNARIVIIPENLQSFPDDFTIYDDHDFSSYGIYLGQTDTDGKKTFNDIPVGKYRVIAQSNVVEYTLQTQSDMRHLTEDGEKVIKNIFGDNLYQKLQDLKNKTKPNTSTNSYSSLAMSLSFNMCEGKSIEIKNTTQSISIAITTI